MIQSASNRDRRDRIQVPCEVKPLSSLYEYERRRSGAGPIRKGPTSLDQLVSLHEDRRRDRQAERFRGPEVDDQVEPCRLDDRQVGGFGALEYLADVDAHL